MTVTVNGVVPDVGLAASQPPPLVETANASGSPVLVTAKAAVAGEAPDWTLNERAAGAA